MGEEFLDEEFLNFAPFPAVLPGFSWLRLIAEPSRHREFLDYAIARQREMRLLLYAPINLGAVGNVFDIGCGVGSDLISLCRNHPRLRADGYTIASQQCEEARRRVELMGLQDRVRIFNRDSAHDALPDLYDLVIGFEVTFHVEDKPALFANIARHLRPAGRIVLADVIANTAADVNMPGLGQFTCTNENFAGHLARSGLRLFSAVDASNEIANFLDDPLFDENIEATSARFPEMKVAEQEHRGWFHFGQALRASLFRYVLLAAEKETRFDVEQLSRDNLAMLLQARPYTQALQAITGRAAAPALNVGAATAEQQPRGGVVAVVQQTLLSLVADTLRMRPDEINPDTRFADFGVSSLQVLQVIDKINREFKLELQIQHFFDHSSIRELTRYVAGQLAPEIIERLSGGAPQHSARTQAAAETGEASRTNHTPAQTPITVAPDTPRTEKQPPGDQSNWVAVIGMAGRFPGAKNVEQFWENIRNGVDNVTEVPADRWDYFDSFDPLNEESRSRSKWGGFLQDVDKFDPLFFGISPTEAKFIDPQQRLFLEASWHALEDAGYAGNVLNRARCGVFVGLISSDYQNILASAGNEDVASGRGAAQVMLGNSASILASRIAYFLNLKGAAATIDTACSSSLVAVHLACRSLTNRETDLMLAGGVSLYLTEKPYLMMSGAGMLSPTGRCRAFADAADGIVPGEAAAVLVLKRFEDAVSDQDHIYGVIRASGINQDGRTNGITAPSSESQKDLELAVYRNGQIDPAQITLVEAHGTGTALGDPIEVAAITNAFRVYTGGVKFCALGSVKSNLGHTSAAAGVTGLIKVLLAMKHRQLPPTLHVGNVNRNIDFDSTPFYVNTTLLPWEPAGGARRMAAVSSFGFSGTNCHLVVEEYAANSPREPFAGGPFVLVLSARTTEQLRMIAESLLVRLAKLHEQRELPDLDDIAFTLQTGRLELTERLATVVDNTPGLISRLARFVRGEAVDEILTGRCAPGSAETGEVFRPNHPITHEECLRAARAWVAGAELDWYGFYTRRRPRRVSLPGYPFEQRRCWLDVQPAGRAKTPPREAIAARAAKTGAVARQVSPNGNSSPRTGPSIDGFFSAPRWVYSPLDSTAHSAAPGEGKDLVVVVEGRQPGGWVAAARSEHPGSEIVSVSLGERNMRHSATRLEICSEDAGAWQWAFSNLPVSDGQAVKIDVIYFLPGVEPRAALDDALASYERCWEHGTVNLFRLIKAALRSGLLVQRSQSRIAKIRIATNHTAAVLQQDSLRPHHAGLHGMAKTLAREYPELDVASLDLDLDDPGSVSADELQEALNTLRREPAIRIGRDVALRQGCRYVRKLVRVSLTQTREQPFVRDGVYIIIGGASGIGAALSSYLAEKFAARLVLVGRRPLEGVIRERVSEIERLGGSVEYISADITGPDAMKKIVSQARSRFGRIHGAIQSALVVNRTSFAEMEESDFRAVLSPKTIGSVRFYEALAAEPLDFLAFFSSGQSFGSFEKRGHYAAACAFKDAYALSRQPLTWFPVRVFNWGFWDVNEVSDDSRQRLADQGVYFMNDAEGVAAIGRVLANPEPQVMVLKAERHAQETFGVEASLEIKILDEQMPSLFEAALRPPQALPPAEKIVRLEKGRSVLEDFCRLLLAGAFRNLGLVEAGQRFDKTDLRERNGVLSKYRRLFNALLDMLDSGGYVRVSGDLVEVTSKMAGAQAEFSGAEQLRDEIVAAYPEIDASVQLVWACVDKLVPVLRGEIAANEFFFSSASSSLLEGIYKGNPVADYFNNCASEALARYVECRLNGGALPQVRLLEIGAGTGSTTEQILAKLEPYSDHIEYCYTDISRAFTQLGRRKFQAAYPFLDYRVLDIGKPVAEQGFDAGSFDVVLAANVLHATSDIRTALRHVKSLLKKNGWLVLLEGVSNQEFMTPTFGMLEGWWHFNDPEVRLKNSPLLDLPTWLRLLGEEGFHRTRAYGPEVASSQGPLYSVIVAESDGALVSAPDQAIMPVAGKVFVEPSVREKDIEADEASPNAAARAETIDEQVARCIIEVLELREGEFDPDQPFMEMGVDSILAVDVINRLNKTLNIRLRPTDMYSLPTARALSEHVRAAVAGDSAPPAEPEADASPATGVAASAAISEDEEQEIMHLLYQRGRAN